MIQYALICENAHKFDAWFRNAQAYDDQHARGIVTCPICGSGQVEKALMAPALGRTRAEQQSVSLSIGHPEHAKLRAAMRALREKIINEADYVGDKFAEEARKIHFKDVEAHAIFGEATPEEASSLLEDGVDFMPLPGLPEDRN